MYKDGIRELRFLKEFERDELVPLLDILQRARKVSPEEDDLLTMLWEQEFSYLRYRYIDVSTDQAAPIDKTGFRAGEAGAQAAQESAAPIDSTVASVVKLEDFDSTLYFLEESEAEYLREEVRKEYEIDMRRNVVAMLLDTYETQGDRGVREEIAGLLDTLMLHILSSGEFKTAAFLLRETSQTSERAPEITPEQKEQLLHIRNRLSEPEVLAQVLQSLDEASHLPDQDDLNELFDQLRVGAIATVFSWLTKAQTPRLRVLLESAAARLAMTTELVPAVALLLAVHFLFSRGLLYCTLLIRNKLYADERSLILRYEVIAFGTGTIAVLASLIAIASVGWAGWVAVAFVLVFAGLLLKRILEEAVAAEELNKIHAMEQVVASDANLAESLRQLERLANRLVDWNGFRIWRLSGGSLRLIYRAGEGLLAEPRENGASGGRLRDTAMSTGESVVISDAARDARARGIDPSAVSIAVVPLRFGDRPIGVVELDHHKRGTYGPKEIALVARFANQLATALHIQDLRQPLLAALARVETQLDTLNDSARALRSGAEVVAQNAAEITRGIGEENEQADRSLDVARSLHDKTSTIARDGGDAATASERATRIATEHRDTIGMPRLFRIATSTPSRRSHPAKRRMSSAVVGVKLPPPPG